MFGLDTVGGTTRWPLGEHRGLKRGMLDRGQGRTSSLPGHSHVGPFVGDQ